MEIWFGFYLSISQGGCCLRKRVPWDSIPENADPEEVADEDKQWIQVNAITGRATSRI